MSKPLTTIKYNPFTFRGKATIAGIQEAWRYKAAPQWTQEVVDEGAGFKINQLAEAPRVLYWTVYLRQATLADAPVGDNTPDPAPQAARCRSDPDASLSRNGVSANVGAIHSHDGSTNAHVRESLVNITDRCRVRRAHRKEHASC